MANKDHVKVNRYVAGLSDEQLLRYVQQHRNLRGKVKFSSFSGDPETNVFWLMSFGVLVSVFVLISLGFYVFGAAWSMWHWVVFGIVGVVPGFFTFMLGIGVVGERFSEYSTYKGMVREVFRRGLSNKM